MIIDSSAIIAILLDEEDSPVYARAIRDARECYLSAATLVEISAVIEHAHGPIVRRRFEDFMELGMIEIVPFDREQAEVARDALRDYGRGSGHPARLNFGDTFAYALARSARMPLLFKGNDFSQTDIASAL